MEVKTDREREFFLRPNEHQAQQCICLAEMRYYYYLVVRFVRVRRES